MSRVACRRVHAKTAQRSPASVRGAAFLVVRGREKAVPTEDRGVIGVVLKDTVPEFRIGAA